MAQILPKQIASDTGQEKEKEASVLVDCMNKALCEGCDSREWTVIVSETRTVVFGYGLMSTHRIEGL